MKMENSTYKNDQTRDTVYDRFLILKGINFERAFLISKRLNVFSINSRETDLIKSRALCL